MNTVPQKERKENHTIDFLKLFFALCIVGIHTDIVKIFPSEHTQWYVMQVVFRMGVPFFFVVSGYFLGGKLWNCTDRKEQWHCVGKYIIKLLPPYLVWSIANLIVAIPLWYRNLGGDLKAVHMMIIKTILFYPTGAMWFVLACVIGAFLLCLFWRHKIVMVFFAIAAHTFALFANTYYFVIANTPLHKVIDRYLEIFLNPRKGIYVGFPLLMIGAFLAYPDLIRHFRASWAAELTILAAIALVLEMTFIYGKETKDDISLCISFLILVPCMVVFFLQKDILHRIPMKWARELSTCIFYPHCFFRTLLRDYYHLENPLVLYGITIAICLVLFALSKKSRLIKKIV